MKRFLLIAMASVTAAACGMPSGLTTPTSAQAKTSTVSFNAASCPSPSPTGPLPFAVFGHPQAAGCPTSTPQQLNPVFSVTPSNGTAPLNVDFSMCGSSDSDPAITVHYAASYGDGSPDDGSDKVCHFIHTYPNSGTYSTTECVWDEIPAHAPGICKTFAVQVTLLASCAVSFDAACYGNNYNGAPGPVLVHAVTAGTAATCGNPLILTANQGGQVMTSMPQPCPPGSGSNGCTYFFPFPQGSGGPQPSTVVSGVNAAGSVTLGPNSPSNFSLCLS